MVRKLFAVAFVGLACGAVAAAADEPSKPEGGKGRGGFDKAKIFEKLDVDGDGKISKDEFAKFQEGMAARIEEKTGKAPPPGLGARLFDKLDADGDGKISKEEFEKGSFGPPGKGGFRGKGSPDGGKKPADDGK